MGRIERFIVPSDLDAYVRNKFTAHGKKLTGDREIMKAVNTAKLFHDWTSGYDGRYRQQVAMTANPIPKQH
jgi:hypothetical protein